MHASRTYRLSVGGSAALVVLISLGSCGSSSDLTPSGAAGSSTTTSTKSGHLTTSQAPVPCTMRQLVFRAVGRPGDTQDVGVLLTVRDASSRSCSLIGRPAATATMSNGRVVAVPADPVTSSLPLRAGPVVLGHGNTGYLRFRVPSECAAGVSHAPPSYTAVALQAGGETATVDITAFSVPASCDFIFVSPYYGQS